MTKVISYMLVGAVMIIVLACGKAENKEVDISASKITNYVNTNDYNSLNILSDSIITNENLGLALVSHFQDSTIELSTATLAIAVSPQMAAHIIFNEVKSLNDSTKVSLKHRTRLLLSWYKNLNRTDNRKVFTNTLDSLALQLDIDKQAQCYVMIASSPSFLASMVNNQPSGNDKEMLIKSIEEAYKENPNDLNQFRNALKK